MAEPNVVVLAAGSRFHGRYEIVRCLKAGGMGAVYEVIDDKTRRRRALKVMHPESVKDADLRARFKLEATITADIESAYIVETFDADIDAASGSPFIVMELLKGEDLSSVLQTRGALPRDEVVQLLGQVALALDKTHAAGIVHRDLKPENLFLTRIDDGTARIKVLDFGIAKIMADSASLANTTRALGTPLYMSKEQIAGDGAITGRADLYALGHITFALLTGEAYWSTEARAVPALYAFFTRVLKGAPGPATLRAARMNVALPASFDIWFAQATALEPRDRFDRASTMIETLAEVLGVTASLPPLFRGHPSSPTLPAAPVTQVSAGSREPNSVHDKPDAVNPLIRVAPAAPHSSGPGQSTGAPVSSDRMSVAPVVRSVKPLLAGAFLAATIVIVIVVAFQLMGASPGSSAGATQAASVQPTTATEAPRTGADVQTAPLPAPPPDARSANSPASDISEVVQRPAPSAVPIGSAKYVPTSPVTTSGKTPPLLRTTPRPPADMTSNGQNDDPTKER
jgi:eukaryotic-like serine/threonine-protein kinase